MTFEFPASVVPGEYAINPSASQGSHDVKFPSFEKVYPERDRYLTVDVSRYVSAERMHCERRSMWNHTWTCAGRVSDVASVGSWFKYDLGPESIIVVRTKKEGVRAFYNVCRHRGNQLVVTDFGKTQRFMCSFHGWQWHNDGKLAEITDRSAFRPGALCADTDLRTVRCETWGGFVFLNLDPQAPPLMEFLAEIPDLMNVYQMDEMNIVKDVVIELNANWKIVLEAFLESYHLQVTHPQARPVLDDVHYQIDIFHNGHGRLQTAIGIPSPRERDRQSLHPGLGAFLAEAGLDPKQFEGKGKVFSAGGDVAGFARSLEQDVATRQADFARRMDLLSGLIEAVADFDRPLVVGVRGAAAGAALVYPLIADYAIGDESATFVFAHQRVGLTPDGGVSYFLPRVVGSRMARSLLLGAAKVDASEALRLGILNRVVPAEDLEREFLAVARRFAAAPQMAIKSAKRLISESAGQSLRGQLRAEGDQIVACVGNPDFAEGVRAFMEKRRAEFPSAQ